MQEEYDYYLLLLYYLIYTTLSHPSHSPHNGLDGQVTQLIINFSTILSVNSNYREIKYLIKIIIIFIFIISGTGIHVNIALSFWTEIILQSNAASTHNLVFNVFLFSKTIQAGRLCWEKQSLCFLALCEPGIKRLQYFKKQKLSSQVLSFSLFVIY